MSTNVAETQMTRDQAHTRAMERLHLAEYQRSLSSVSLGAAEDQDDVPVERVVVALDIEGILAGHIPQFRGGGALKPAAAALKAALAAKGVVVEHG